MDEAPRHPARPFWIILAVVAVWVAADLLWAVTGSPAALVDYGPQVQAQVRSAQPEGCDAWPLLVEAAGRANQVESEVRARYNAEPHVQTYWHRPDFNRVRVVPVDPDRITWEQQALDMLAQTGAIALLEEAAACPCAVRPIPSAGPLIEQLLPSLAHFRLLGQMRVAEMRIAAVQGRADDHRAAFEQTLALARGSAAQSTIIERLVAAGIASMALEELRQEIVETPFDAAACAALRDAMDRRLRWPPPSHILEGERAIALDFIQRSYSDDGHGGGRLDPDAAAGLIGPFGGLAGAFQAGRAEATATIDELYDLATVMADLDAPARTTTNTNALTNFQTGLSPRLLLVSNLVPALDRFMEGEDDLATRIEGTRLMLALAEHRARHGPWPAAQEDLVPEILDAVPLDPACGRPFVYRRDPAEGVAFILYSRGVNGVDDSADVDLRNPTTQIFFTSVHAGDVVLSFPRTMAEEPR